MQTQCPFLQQQTAVLCFRHQSIDNRRSSGHSRKMRFPPNSLFCIRGCALLLFVAVCLVRAGWPEWNGSRVRIVCPFAPQYVCLLVKKGQLCCSATRCGTWRALCPADTYIHRRYTIICPKAWETSVRVLCLDEAYGLQLATIVKSARGMGHYSDNTNGDVEA